MKIRTLDSNISVPDINQINQLRALHWHTLHCELVTPLYGGGVKAATIDKEMPIRVSTIRGQLRFWWRLLAKHKADWGFNGDLGAIRQAESRLWGGTGNEVHASLVFLKVTNTSKSDSEKWAEFRRNQNTNRYRGLPYPKDWADVPYVLFPAQGKTSPDRIEEEPKELIKAGLTWQLHLALAKNINEQQTHQVWEAIRWWANFGGLGARTRRGLGAVQVTGQHITPITAVEAQAIGCQLILRPQSNSSYTAWKDSVDQLKDFRQGHSVGVQKIEVGRNKGDEPHKPGRSRWSEPDAIRNTVNQRSDRHARRVTQGDYFPRAAFGLPIIFKFKDDGNSRTDEPAQSSLQPIVNGGLEERMASPIILRPYFNGQGWQAAALRLPHQHVNDLQLKLIQGNRSFDVEYWDRAQAENIRPIHAQDGTDALSAFLNYFGN